MHWRKKVIEENGILKKAKKMFLPYFHSIISEDKTNLPFGGIRTYNLNNDKKV